MLLLTPASALGHRSAFSCPLHNKTHVCLRPLQHQTEGNNTGFDCSYVFGNFLIMNTGLWMKPLVQDFVQLCLLSGGVYRYR